MRAKHVFGLTPWGAYFIEAMETLADEGRLARGRSYAGNGSVLELHVSGGEVQAKVSGNYAPFYRVAIRFKPLPEKAARAVQSAFDADPLLSARVAAGDLPDGFLESLGKQGVSLVPRQWSEMERSCTCPDYGDPCKHQAAVYYLLAQEIDRDPMVLFRLRGVAPGAAHGAAPGVIAGVAASSGPGLDTVSGKNKSKKPAVSSDVATILPASVPDPVVLRMVPPWPDPVAKAGDPYTGEPLAGLGSLANYTVAIPALLPPSRGLAPFDLRMLCSAMYMEAAGRIPELLGPEPMRSPDDAEVGLEATMDGARARAFASAHFVLLLTSTGKAMIEVPRHGKLGLLAASRLFAACDERDGSASYRFLRSFFIAIRSIASACAFAPDVRVHGSQFQVLWKPARFVSDVDALLSALEPVTICPQYQRLKAATATEAKAAGTGRVPDSRSTIELMAVAFLAELIAMTGFVPPSIREAKHPAAVALFGHGAVSCSRPGEKALPAALDAWLSVYDLASKRLPLELSVSAVKKSRTRSGVAESYKLSAALVSQGTDRIALQDVASAGGKQAGEALSFAALLSNFVPALGRLGVQKSVDLSEAELAGFVLDAAPLLGRFGVAIVLPKELSRLSVPRPALRTKKKASLVSYLDLATAFSFDWTVAIGEERLSVAEFSELLDSGLRLVRWRNEWVRIDPAEAARVMARVSSRKAPDSMEAMRAVLSGEIEVEGELSGAFDFLTGAGRKTGDDAAVPAALLASLRPYQERGFRWMLGNFERGLGCLLADDMGLGKTVQTIAAMLYLKECALGLAGHLQPGDIAQKTTSTGVLVCAPASLLSNWERELEKFAPSLSVCAYYGTGRRLRTADVTLSSYETWIRDQKKLAGHVWSLVVLDEAHYIKNPESRRAKAVKAIKTERRLALTGTPVENNLAELWSIFDFALPGYLGTLARFSAEFSKPIELDRSESVAGRLRAVTAPFIMRRLKTDAAIVADLPDKVVLDEYAALTPEQAALYEAVAGEGLARVSSADAGSRLGAVLALITALKQVSNHPRNYDKESPGSSERSGKSRLFVALLESALGAGERVLVFSQYVQMLEILSGVVQEELGVEPYFLHGGMTRKKRDEQVSAFQSGRGPGVFLVSLKAGGVGLNLTAASRVIHYDLWFNPAVENQATDRAFRIGQSKNVFVHRLITRDTIEERIDAMISSKRGLSELTVRAGESWIATLDDDELRKLVALR